MKIINNLPKKIPLLPDLCWKYSISFGCTIDRLWRDSDISGKTLQDGFYIVNALVSVHTPDGIYEQNEFVGTYTGMMNWRGKTTPDLSEEIILNFSGEAPENLRFFLRTKGKDDKETHLQHSFNVYVQNPKAYADIALSFLKIF